jgi:hypothetical protein
MRERRLSKCNKKDILKLFLRQFFYPKKKSIFELLINHSTLNENIFIIYPIAYFFSGSFPTVYFIKPQSC